ncbi:uncharacterized protein BT62DRAFT_1014288 [Guyanagaster necrorhizus]|uniref:Uncharacterized protein n=1 Tax=Guyanagaster necrorhizus TaxID=856835 RepID=A0A9P8AKX6_9AGAR|nr:uncharacterized protein BT62DRAFT_1014288 [Guyanagaster necrorhizus MCA 3950]KAG7439160.1 hypothetical protein BT62DRAFT_1014288 [Guyanagaster necrorhizus MCA 3950]
MGKDMSLGWKKVGSSGLSWFFSPFRYAEIYNEIDAQKLHCQWALKCSAVIGDGPRLGKSRRHMEETLRPEDQARPATMREEHLLSADANGIENRRLCLLGPLLLQVRARPVRAPKGRLFTGAKGASTEKPVLNAVTCKHEYWTYIGGRQYPPPNPSFPRINGPADPLACITNMNTNRNQLCSTNSNKTTRCDQTLWSIKHMRNHLDLSGRHPYRHTCRRGFLNNNSYKMPLFLSDYHHCCDEGDEEFQSSSALNQHDEQPSRHNCYYEEGDCERSPEGLEDAGSQGRAGEPGRGCRPRINRRGNSDVPGGGWYRDLASQETNATPAYTKSHCETDMTGVLVSIVSSLLSQCKGM